MYGQNHTPQQPGWPPQSGTGAPGPWTTPQQSYGHGEVPGQSYGQVPGQPPYGQVPSQPPYGYPAGQPSGTQPFDPATAARSAGQWATNVVQRHGLRTVLHVAVPALTILGLVMPTAFLIKNVVWAIFAIAVALGSLVGRRDGARSWSIAAACTGGLFLFWVLIALPSVTSFGGFLLTAAVVVAGVALWIHPQRRWV